MQKLPSGCNSISLCFQESFEKAPNSYSNGYSYFPVWDKNTHTEEEQFHLIKWFSLQCSLLPSVTLAQLHDALPLLSLSPRRDAMAGPRLLGGLVGRPSPVHPTQMELPCGVNSITAGTTGGRGRQRCHTALQYGTETQGLPPRLTL